MWPYLHQIVYELVIYIFFHSVSIYHSPIAVSTSWHLTFSWRNSVIFSEYHTLPGVQAFLKTTSFCQVICKCLWLYDEASEAIFLVPPSSLLITLKPILTSKPPFESSLCALSIPLFCKDVQVFGVYYCSFSWSRLTISL